MIFSHDEKKVVEELVPYARYALRKKMTFNGITGGYDLKPGEKVLLVVDNKFDPVVVEAFYRAIREIGATVDLIVHDKGGPETEWHGHDEITMAPEREYCWSSPHWVMNAANNYNLIIDSTIGPQYAINARFQFFWWYTREQLKSPGLTFPEEVLDMINIKTQEMAKKIWKVRLTDLEGTDIRYTFFDEYWGKTDIPPYEKTPYMPAHILTFPFIPIPQSDMEGVYAATCNHVGVFPNIRLHVERGKITRIEGGGKYGEVWRDLLERLKDADFGGRLPGPGVGWVTGIPIGTDPKISRTRNGLFTRSTLMIEANRAGVVHIDFGPHCYVNDPKELREYSSQGKTIRHIHVQLYFVTLEAETKDGKKFKILDNGHLTALDDPQVREVAAKYGDPDELLKIDWIPAMPGISVPGSYQEYAKDPLTWMRDNPTAQGYLPYVRSRQAFHLA